MTLKEAIKIQTIHNDHNPNYTDADREAAHQLGIEALKFFKDLEDRGALPADARLPGETKE